jgi:RimJ/RimL family protein N-acetyltransferase
MPINLQPLLKNNLISLKPLRETDFEALYAVASDPLIWEQHPDKLRHTRDVFKKYFDSGIESGSAFLISDAASGDIIGCTRYYDHDPAKKQIAIGWTFLARSHWGGPVNTALKTLMLDYAFTFAETVLLHIGENNMRSRRAVEKLGGEFTEQVSDTVTYAIEKEKWQNSNLLKTENPAF